MFACMHCLCAWCPLGDQRNKLDLLEPKLHMVVRSLGCWELNHCMHTKRS